MKNNLDFLIIGAQKSGTTTLFKLLSQHHNIYIPPGKEAPYFGAKKESEGWDKYIETFFTADPQSLNKLWGTVTPHYMSKEDVAEKIYNINPNIKLIAILRQPVDRAFSHYRMEKKRGKENREFNDALTELLQPENLAFSRESPNSTNSYIVWGEYGRLLKSYLRFFPKEQILICFMNELEKNPQKVIDQISTYLNIETFVPEGLGTKFHKGGSKRKLNLFNKYIPFRKLIKTLIIKAATKKNYVKWRYWLDQWNTKETDDKMEISNENLAKLIELYKSDYDCLSHELKINIPWEPLLNKMYKTKNN